MQYYFEVALGTPATVVLSPGFDASWSNTPYWVVRADDQKRTDPGGVVAALEAFESRPR